MSNSQGNIICARDRVKAAERELSEARRLLDEAAKQPGRTGWWIIGIDPCRNITPKAFAGDMLTFRAEGRVVDDPHGAWATAIKRAGLPGVTRHTLRHTRATHLMLAGIEPWEAAGALGMTVRTLERVYGHHSPDWQEKAANV